MPKQTTTIGATRLSKGFFHPRCLLQSLPLVCFGLLALLALLMLAPVCPDQTNALGTTISYLPSTVTLSMQPDVSATVEPTADGVFQTTDTAVGVKVTNSENFTVSIKGDTNMTGSEGNLATIQPVATNTPTDSFPNNTWGYSWSKGNTTNDLYQPVPSEYLTLDEQPVSDETVEQDYKLSFGAKIDTTIPADTYRSAVTISVVSSPKIVVETNAAFQGITTMQGMTPNACSEALFGETAQLEDTRDGKKYWVTKLADGNCWMTQNLDLDLTTDGLTVANGSNVDWYAGSNWEGTSNGKYPPKDTDKTSLANNSASTNTNSWDQGMYVYTTPIASTSCGFNLTGINTCSPTGNGPIKTFINVDGWVASDDPDFTKKNGLPINETDKVYDAHYLLGNYYSYNAATAGTGAFATTDGTNAKSDICPRGWELPLSGAVNNNSDSFYRLLTTQGMVGIASANIGSTKLNTDVTVRTVYYDQDGNPTESAQQMTINEALTTTPLFFVRGGFVYGSVLYHPGGQARYWSRSSNSASYAYYIYVNDANIGPSYYDDRYRGYSLRCLYAPGE